MARFPFVDPGSPLDNAANAVEGTAETLNDFGSQASATALDALRDFGDNYNPGALALRAFGAAGDAAHWATSAPSTGPYGATPKPKGARGTAEAQETSQHALAAKASADSKMGMPGVSAPALPTTDEKGAKSSAAPEINLGNPLGFGVPLRDPQVPVPQKSLNAIANPGQGATSSGVRAFRTKDGHITFTNLPLAYAGSQEEVPYAAGARAERDELPAYPNTLQGTDPRNYETVQRSALVDAARRGAAGPQEGSSSMMDLKPGGTAENPVATPGYVAMVEQQLRDRARLGGAAAEVARASMTPEDNARLAAYIKDAGNNQLGTLKFAIEAVTKVQNEIAQLEQRLQDPAAQTPAIKATIEEALKRAKARQDAYMNLYATSNKQQYYGGPAPQGNNEVTPN